MSSNAAIAGCVWHNADCRRHAAGARGVGGDTGTCGPDSDAVITDSRG